MGGNNGQMICQVGTVEKFYRVVREVGLRGGGGDGNETVRYERFSSAKCKEEEMERKCVIDRKGKSLREIMFNKLQYDFLLLQYRISTIY